MAGVNGILSGQRSQVVLSFVIACVLSLYLAIPAQAQLPVDFFDVSGFPTPWRDTGRAVGTLCPQLSPNATGATGDLQIRCTELVGNRRRGDVDIVNPLLQMAPEEVSAQGTSSVEIVNQHIGARLAALRAGATGISQQRFALNVDGPGFPGTMVASLDPGAAGSSTGSTNALNPFNRLGIFVNGTLTLGDKDATIHEVGFDFDTLGVTVGIDYRMTDSFVLGGAFSYASTDIDLDETSVRDTPAGGGIDAESFSLSVYAIYYISNFYIDGIGSLGWTDYDIDRNIIYSIPATDRQGNLMPGMTTTVRQTARGNTDGTQYSLSLSTGYDFSASGFTLGPFARVHYIMVDIDGYSEEIDNEDPGFGLVLEFESQDIASLTSAVGAQASYAISTGVGVLLPQVRFEWVHEFKNESQTVTARFVADPTRTPIRYVTEDPDRDFFNVGAGLSATFSAGLSSFVYYETVLGLEDITAHNIVLGVRKEL